MVRERLDGFCHERDMLPKWSDAGQMIFQGKRLIQSDGQIMVRWFSKERDKSHWWSDTGQIDFQSRETHNERWSDNGQMVFR